jgi:hypothetical protein
MNGLEQQHGPWKRWFAWYPVTIAGRMVWLRTIERKRCTFVFFPHEDTFIYREIPESGTILVGGPTRIVEFALHSKLQIKRTDPTTIPPFSIFARNSDDLRTKLFHVYVGNLNIPSILRMAAHKQQVKEQLAAIEKDGFVFTRVKFKNPYAAQKKASAKQVVDIHRTLQKKRLSKKKVTTK